MSDLRNGRPGRGVLVSDLHCPSCGHPYDLPLRPQRARDDDEFTVSTFGGPRFVLNDSPWFIECPLGHRWTVVTLYRVEGQPDALQLGAYIGNG